MTAVEVTSALGTRKTVRITYSRSTDLHRVDIALGQTLTEPLLANLVTAELAEVFAERAAYALGLDVTRVDVD